MEMTSKAIGRLAMAGDTFTAEYVEFEVKRALEWLGPDRNEGRRHAAVSACQEQGLGAMALCWGPLLPSKVHPPKRMLWAELLGCEGALQSLSWGSVALCSAPSLGDRDTRREWGPGQGIA